MPRPIASLSLDLDNKWAYLRSGGREGWENYPTYLPKVALRFAEMCDRYRLSTTIFVVGADLDCTESATIVGDLHHAGHEIANHTQNHYPWLERLSDSELLEEVAAAEQRIQQVTGQRPVGFRGPGFSRSDSLMQLLAERDYLYDSTVFPTVLGPVANVYAAMIRRKPTDQESQPKQKFAGLADGFASLRPYQILRGKKSLLEIPVTTMPLVRVPIHVTYLMFLRQKSKLAASAYLRMAMRLCRIRRVGPVMLLHPLDFLGGDEEPDLDFVPGMKLSWPAKRDLLYELVEAMQYRFDIVPMREQAQASLS